MEDKRPTVKVSGNYLILIIEYLRLSFVNVDILITSLIFTLGYFTVQKSILKRRTSRRAPFLSGNCSLKLVTTMMREMIN